MQKPIDFSQKDALAQLTRMALSRRTPAVQPQQTVVQPQTPKLQEEPKGPNIMANVLKPTTGVPTRSDDILIPADVNLSPDQHSAIRDIISGKNVFITGPAGTGKTFIIDIVRQMFEERNIVVAVTSTTGNSAVQIGGSTYQSWAGIGLCGTKDTALTNVLKFKKPQDRIRNTRVLILDEVSMCPAHMLDILDYVCRIVRNNQRPFGGIQLILSGDFYQLKPVKAESYAFESERWNLYVESFHELTHIFRQSDRVFCKALNDVRTGNVTQETANVFMACIGKTFDTDIKPTELYPINEWVDSKNEDELWKLASDTNRIMSLDAADDIAFKIKSGIPLSEEMKLQIYAKLNKECQAPKSLLLCIGAQVMLTKNINVAAGLANGSRAIVIGFGPGNEPKVRFLNGVEMYMSTDKWSVKFNSNIRAVRLQYPLKLAWAMSIHKSQGSTVDLAQVEFGDRAFGEGMIYVALSRCRTIEGLVIKSIDWSDVKTSKKVREFYARYSVKL